MGPSREGGKYVLVTCSGVPVGRAGESRCTLMAGELAEYAR
jgi:hypothetical protein